MPPRAGGLLWAPAGDGSVSETSERADVLTFNDAGKLVTFEPLGDQTHRNRVFAK